MRISDWSSDVCSSDLNLATRGSRLVADSADDFDVTVRAMARILGTVHADRERIPSMFDAVGAFFDMLGAGMRLPGPDGKKLTALKGRSEEHTSELQSLIRISFAVVCLKKKNQTIYQ